MLRHLPEPLKPVIEFAWRTGWRITSEVLPLEWRSASKWSTGNLHPAELLLLRQRDRTILGRTLKAASSSRHPRIVPFELVWLFLSETFQGEGQASRCLKCR